MPKWKSFTFEAPASPTPAEPPSASRVARAAKPASASGDPRRVELYWRWAEATHWRGYYRGLGEGPPAVPDSSPPAAVALDPGIELLVIAQARDPEVFDRVLTDHEFLKIPELYRGVIGGTDDRSLFFTARLSPADLPRLATLDGLRWEVSLPRRPAQTTAQATTRGRFGPSREEAALAGQAILEERQGDGSQDGPCVSEGPTMAIVDYGCPFLRTNLTDSERRTRLVALWDQGDRSLALLGDDAGFQRRRWWDVPAWGLYGRELRTPSIRSIVDQMNRVTPPLPENDIYRSIDYLVAYDDARRRVWGSTHGGHVMDLAAGSPDPLLALVDPPPAAMPASGDAAAEANLVFVQLPALTAADSSGGSLAAHLLDAVRYAMAVCPSHPLVVNISYGTFAGPHDGSSLVEAAFTELLEKRPHDFHLVLAAGNARDSRCHVRRVVRVNQPALLSFALTPDDTTDTFLEMWYPRPVLMVGELKVRVRSAGRSWSAWTATGEAVAYCDDATGELLALVQNEAHVMHGDRALALVALAPTSAAINDDGPLNDPGLWEVEVALDTDTDQDPTAVTIDAWIERDDPADNTQLGEQPHFCGLDRDEDRDTLSSIATGPHTFVVGGYRWSDGSVASYSSLPGPACGPTLDDDKERLPLLMAPCELDGWQPSLRAAAVDSNRTFRLSGTSIAAPVFARRLLNLLVKQDAERATSEADRTTSEGTPMTRRELADRLLADADESIIRRATG